MKIFSRPKPPAGHAAARRQIEYHRTDLQNAAKTKLTELSAAIDSKSDDLPDLLADTFPYTELMTTAIRQLDAVLETKPKQTARSSRRTYTISSRLVHNIWDYTTSAPKAGERLMFATGIETASGDVVISETMNVRMSSQSAAYVAAHPGHTAAKINQLDTSGHKLWLMAHSHIMTGKASTRPSQTDINHQNRMVDFGLTDMLGMICNLDGWVRLFTTNRPFDLQVYGNGVTVTDDNPREKILKLDVTEKADATASASLAAQL